MVLGGTLFFKVQFGQICIGKRFCVIWRNDGVTKLFFKLFAGGSGDISTPAGNIHDLEAALPVNGPAAYFYGF